MIWLLKLFLGGATAKRFAPLAWGAAVIAGLGALVWAHNAYTGAFYDRGVADGKAAWESAALKAVRAENERLKAEAEALRRAQIERDRQYAEDISEITRRLVAGARRDHVAFSAGVVGVLNEGTKRANSDVAASTAAKPQNVPGAPSSDSGPAERGHERGGGG